MTSLDEWYAAQREHLDMGLWLDLALRVARVDAMISAEYFSSAENALPPLYDIIRQHDLPDWRVFIQLMESSLILGATGNLNRAMDVAIQALSAAEKLPGTHNHALRLGARLTVMRCWLKVDEVGYAEDVLKIGRHTLVEGTAGDWTYWFNASNAWALWALDRQEEANKLLMEMLADLPTVARKADYLEGQAYIAYRMRRQSEAAAFYGEAAAAFTKEELHYSAARCLLNKALCLYEAGEHALSGILLEQMMSRVRTLNTPHYAGLAYCFRGRNALAVGDYETALSDLTRAHSLYEGRGWLRDEAQICIERLEAMRALGGSSKWDGAAEKARLAVARLRSRDFLPRLAEVLGEDVLD
jgi:tetratricopeptide (TPR) repeat protein